ncbi:winged helix-turn-helix domain-containing protein [Lysinimonas soli]|uniref:Winged helix-turn-helix domain-containing protein n=1 Tax=Lysinimonas soli TaxID=1074233 RepID=A0ABW0NLX4_9MICO
MPDTITPAAARRIALAAQGFGRSHPESVGTRQLKQLFERLGLLQIDSVNVFERSHYLPVFARLGGYDKALLDRLTFARRGPYTEYLAHVAAFVPVADYPLWGFRRARLREKYSRDEWVAENRPMLDWLLAELADKGPMPASRFEHVENVRKGPWWGWGDVKLGLEYLFSWGEVVSAGRRNFERVYALPQQVIPSALLEAEIPADEAVRELVRRGSRALGIGTAKDIADYYRLSSAATRLAIDELVDAGELRRVTVPGWPRPAFLHGAARIPRRIETAALLSPFDPVVWERTRALTMFGFHYRIELYTPAPKRIFGYYTLPVLVDEALVGRIDLKSDRQNGVLRVQSAWHEPGAPAGMEERIAPVLRQAAAWQGLGDIEVMDRGDRARSLAAELGTTVTDPDSRPAP